MADKTPQAITNRKGFISGNWVLAKSLAGLEEHTTGGVPPPAPSLQTHPPAILRKAALTWVGLLKQRRIIC